MFSGDAVMRSCVRPKSWGGPIHCWSPNPKVGGLISPGPRGCCAYVATLPCEMCLQSNNWKQDDFCNNTF